MDAYSSELAIFIGLLVSASFIAFWLGFYRRNQTEVDVDRLSEMGDRQRMAEALELEAPFVARVIQPVFRQWVRRLGQLMPHRNVDRLQLQLERAGKAHDLSVSDFLGVRLITTVATGALVVAMLFFQGLGVGRSLLFGTAAGLIGSLLPSFWLRRQIKQRQNAVRKGLPDALDMLSVSVTAGLGLDGAMQTLSRKWDNAVAQEFGQVVREIQIGVPRMEALRSVARRVDVTEMSHFIAVLVQADQLGLSISTVLKTQSDQMRLVRRQRAEEAANKAPIKMMFPLVLLIFPAIFAVILGPAVPRLLDLFNYL